MGSEPGRGFSSWEGMDAVSGTETVKTTGVLSLSKHGRLRRFQRNPVAPESMAPCYRMPGSGSGRTGVAIRNRDPGNNGARSEIRCEPQSRGLSLESPSNSAIY